MSSASGAFAFKAKPCIFRRKKYTGTKLFSDASGVFSSKPICRPISVKPLVQPRPIRGAIPYGKISMPKFSLNGNKITAAHRNFFKKHKRAIIGGAVASGVAVAIALTPYFAGMWAAAAADLAPEIEITFEAMSEQEERLFVDRVTDTTVDRVRSPFRSPFRSPPRTPVRSTYRSPMPDRVGSEWRNSRAYRTAGRRLGSPKWSSNRGLYFK